MDQKLTVFSWEHEPVLDRFDRRLRAQDPTAAAASKPAGEHLRDAPRDVDRVLSALAIQWRDAFQADLRPVHLCDRYPRIANRLALSWKDDVLTKLVLASLLHDKRGGRKGFPAEVAEELRRLRVEIARRAMADAGP